MFAIRLLLVATLVGISTSALSSQAEAAAPDCHGRWFWRFNLEVPRGFWSDGQHTYQLRGSLDGSVYFTPGPISFTVTPAAPLHRGQAQLRFYGVLVYESGTFGPVDQLAPAQDTVIQVNDGVVGSKQDADVFAARESFEVRWDGGNWIPMPRDPVLSFCSFDPARVGVWDRQWGPTYRP